MRVKASSNAEEPGVIVKHTTVKAPDPSLLDEEFSDTDLDMSKRGTMLVGQIPNIVEQPPMDSILENSKEIAEKSLEVAITSTPKRRSTKAKSKSPNRSKDNSAIREEHK